MCRHQDAKARRGTSSSIVHLHPSKTCRHLISGKRDTELAGARTAEQHAARTLEAIKTTPVARPSGPDLPLLSFLLLHSF